jgi:hypothetical protein
MSSNVINLFEVKQLRDANMTPAKEAPRQLELFESDIKPAGRHDCNIFIDATEPATPRSSVGDENFLFVVFVENFQFQDDFLNFCKSIHPDLIIDLRVAPRLDFVRPLRRQAFELFEICDIEYRDLLGRLGATTYDLTQRRFEEVIAAVNYLHMNRVSGRPTIILFDDATFAQSCTTKISHGVNVTALDSETVRRMVFEGARARM